MKRRIGRVLLLVLIQQGSLFVFLRVLHWNFFLSASVATALAFACGVLAVAALKPRSQ